MTLPPHTHPSLPDVAGGDPPRPAAAGLGPQRFRKRPVEVEAIRYTGGNADAVTDWADGGTGTRVAPTAHWGGMCGEPEHEDNFDLHVLTLEDGSVGAHQVEHIASPGDWIIRGIRGELYPCRGDIFESTYDLVAS